MAMNQREVLTIGANNEIVSRFESVAVASDIFHKTKGAIRYAIEQKQQINGLFIVYADERETYRKNLTRTGAFYIDFVLGQSVVWLQQYEVDSPPKVSVGVITEMRAIDCTISLLPSSPGGEFINKKVRYFELQIPDKKH